MRQGGSGGQPQKANEISKIKQNGGFSFVVRFFKFIFYNFAGLPKPPKNFELAPQISEITTSASQLP